MNYVHNKLTRAIEDVGSLDATGNEVYFAANPGEGVATTMFVTGLTAPFTTPKPLRQYDALDLTISRRFSNNWFGSANLTISRLYGNYAGLANSDEIPTPTTGVVVGDRAAAGRQHRPPGHRRRPRVGPRRARVGLARQPRRRWAAWRPIVRSSRSSTAPTRCRSARRSAASSTPAAARR